MRKKLYYSTDFVFPLTLNSIYFDERNVTRVLWLSKMLTVRFDYGSFSRQSYTRARNVSNPTDSSSVQIECYFPCNNCVFGGICRVLYDFDGEQSGIISSLHFGNRNFQLPVQNNVISFYFIYLINRCKYVKLCFFFFFVTFNAER